MAKAVSEIRHGKGDKEKTFAPGDTVNKSDFEKEEWEQLVSAGAITEGDFPPPAQEATAGHAEPTEEEQKVGEEGKGK